MSKHTELEAFDLSKAADQCVLCGMCLPHCPTYKVSQHEAESPRGRISLIKAFAEGNLEASDSLETHIQSCTGCLTCQNICPAKVDYQNILDAGKTMYRREQSFISRMLQRFSIQIATHHWGHTLISLSSHFTKVLPKNRYTQLLHRVDKKKIANKASEHYSTSVNVFTGCTGNVFDSQTLNSLIKLLNMINVEAKLADNIQCCGALSQHSGLPKQAEQYLSELKSHLAKQTTGILLSFATGCGRQLNEHLSNGTIQHFDAMQWLHSQQSFKQLVFSSTSQTILVHTPCTVNTSEQEIIYDILKRIPNIELIEFNDQLSCCGAGGMQLTSPEQSNQQLLKEKLSTIEKIQPDVIVSPNIGCSLNFKLGLDNTNLDIEVIHPLTLLARQLNI